MAGRKVIIAGGSGQIGRHLVRHLKAKGDTVLVLTRGESGPGRLHWDAMSLGEWASEVDGADVVINLAGRTVNCRYNAENRRQIYASRLDSTRVLGEAIAAAASPPAVWLNAATATIYVDSRDTPQGDDNGEIWRGDEAGIEETWLFSVDVAKQWERALEEAPTPNTRKVALRASMVMDWEAGGVFQVLSRLVRFGLGGRQADGGQMISWIHIADFMRALDFIVEHESIEGPINVCGPNPVPNAEFMRGLRSAWGRRFGLPATKWMLGIGAWFLRTETELILKSRYVVPQRLLEMGFEFDHPHWAETAQLLVHQSRQAREA